MKTQIQVIEEMVKKYPNDFDLGGRVRWYINWQKELLKKAREHKPKGI